MTVLLTGATGFLGSRVAHTLLTTRNERVIALGRGTPALLRIRVVNALRVHGEEVTHPGNLSRLRCVSGDVAQPWLGLSPALHARIAREVDAVWHCAGDIALTGERDRLFRVNAQGTAHVLAFMEMTAAHCRLVHLSTMAVAGARTEGCIMEDDLTDAHGFETHYDASKFEAERLVRHWAERQGRPAVVLRPSIVASDRTHPDEAAGHPLSVLGSMIEAVALGGAPGIPAQRGEGTGLRLRLAASPTATLNIVPDSYATQAMVRIGYDTAPDVGDVRTFHVVHAHNTPVQALFDAMEAHYPGLRIDCFDGEVHDASLAEQYIASHLAGFLSYCRHRRTYDRSRALAATPELAGPAPVDAGFLRRALGFTGQAVGSR
ncbi:SDR family oxidoreductase [Streptomyces beigongshangae]|uniref:SDR family oxidoreductase n=1 Tax=Streptomyces beigongshangae TaxID=2841597 RepID=UPI001C866642|nr:SDR family oxidoreductase [Streptomyces sp. REN17]